MRNIAFVWPWQLNVILNPCFCFVLHVYNSLIVITFFILIVMSYRMSVPACTSFRYFYTYAVQRCWERLWPTGLRVVQVYRKFLVHLHRSKSFTWCNGSPLSSTRWTNAIIYRTYSSFLKKTRQRTFSTGLYYTECHICRHHCLWVMGNILSLFSVMKGEYEICILTLFALADVVLMTSSDKSTAVYLELNSREF